MSRKRWDVGFAVALSVIGFGLLLADPVLVTAAIIGLVYVIYGSVSRLPDDVSLAATREFETSGTDPGEQVTVRLHVENTGETTLPDVRVSDGVPAELGVVDGSPRGAVSLSPGESRTIEYRLVLQRGQFEFTPPVGRVRSLAGSDQRTVELAVTGDSSLRCATTGTDTPLVDTTSQHVGSVPTATGGSGLEFHSTRRYQPGDPTSRIDWSQLAKTGEFVTVQYRRERAVRTVIVVDCRPCTRVRPQAGYPTGGTLAAYAAERVYEAFQQDGVTTNLTAVGLGDEQQITESNGVPWVGPESANGASRAFFRGAHRVARGTPGELSIQPPSRDIAGVRQSTATTDVEGDDAAATPPSRESATSRRTKRLLSQLPADAQVILCSPVLDNWPVECGRELVGRDYACTLLSPNVTAGKGYGQRLGSVHRRLRLRALERIGVDVTDWSIDRPVEYALRDTPQ